MSEKILVVDDDRAMGELMVTVLRNRKLESTFTPDGEDALRILNGQDFDVVITDVRMRGLNGIQLCERIATNRPDVPVIVVTAFGSLDVAIQAIRAGAWDFVTKPFDNDMLVLTVERALRHRSLREEVHRLRRIVAESSGAHDDGLIGESAALRAVREQIGPVAQTDASVLITGESGTGKEVVARAIHAQSARREGPFVAVNCAAVPETLLESELFGHVKGAFTDARASRKGLFAQASGGTVFLDEVGEIPIGLQPKLLRVLQERSARPLGGDAEVSFDVRVVAASNRDLETAVEEKRFREDLFYRLNVIHIALPPLRARSSDALLLAQHFIERLAVRTKKEVRGLSPAAAERIVAYAWPGNVRELQNAIERAVALTRFDEISVDDLPEKIRNYRHSHVVVAGEDPSELVPMDEVEKRYIARVMEAAGGNKTLAAQVLGFDRTTLYRKLERYSIDPRAAR